MHEKTKPPSSEHLPKSTTHQESEAFAAAAQPEFPALDIFHVIGTQNQARRIQQILQTQRAFGNHYAVRRLCQSPHTKTVDVSYSPEADHIARARNCGSPRSAEDEFGAPGIIQRTLDSSVLEPVAPPQEQESEHLDNRPAQESGAFRRLGLNSTTSSEQPPHPDTNQTGEPETEQDTPQDDESEAHEDAPPDLSIKGKLSPDNSGTTELETIGELEDLPLNEGDDASEKLPKTKFPGESETTAQTEDTPPELDLNSLFGNLGGLFAGIAGQTPPSAAPSPSSGGMIQRLSVDDLNPTAIISQIRDLFSSSDSTERDAEQSVDQQTSQTEGQFEDQSAQFEQGMQTAGSETEQSTEQAESQAQNAESQTDEAGSTMEQQGNQAASRVGAVQPGINIALCPVGPLLNPDLMTDISQRVARVGEAADLGGLPGDIRNDVNAGLTADGEPGWNCDQAEIAAIAGNVSRTLLGRFIRVGDSVTGGRVSDAIAFAERMGTKIRGVASSIIGGVQRGAQAVGSFIQRQLTPVTNIVNQGMQTARNLYTSARDFLSRSYEQGRSGLISRISSVKDSAQQFVETQINRVRQGIQTAIGTAQRIVGGLGEAIRRLLPDWVINGTQALGQRISNFASRVRSGVQRLGQMAVDFKNRAVEAVRGWVDQRLQRFASAYQRFLPWKDRLLARARQIAQRAVELIPEPIRNLASQAADIVGGRIRDLRAAADRVKQKVTGAVCETLEPAEAAATPCLNQYMPFDQNTTSSVSVFGSAAATIPLGEFGIPASAELKQGARITVARTGDKTYTVTIEGEAGVALTSAAIKEEITLDVDLPSGGSARMRQIWAQLTGGSSGSTPTPGGNGGTPGGSGSGPTPSGNGGGSGGAGTGGSTRPPGGGGQPGQPGGVGGSSGIELEGKAGSTYNVAMVYSFNTNTPCQLTTMAGLLASYGAAGALSSIVPAPFSQFLNAAVSSSFSDNLTSMRLTNTSQLEGSAALPGDAAKLTAALTAANSVEMFRIPEGTEPDVEGNQPGDRGVRLSQRVTGSAAGELTVADLFKGAAGGSVSAAQILTLAFTGETIVPRSLSSELSATLSADLFSAGMLPAAVASAAGATVEERLRRLRDQGVRGNLTATMKQTVTRLDEVTAQLESYFSTADPSSVNSGAVLNIVRSFLARPGVLVERLEVKLTETERLGVTVGGVVGGETQTIGVTGTAGGEQNLVHTLYP